MALTTEQYPLPFLGMFLFLLACLFHSTPLSQPVLFGRSIDITAASAPLSATQRGGFISF